MIKYFSWNKNALLTMIFVVMNAFFMQTEAQIIMEEKAQYPTCTEDKNMIIGKTTLSGLEQNQEFWSEYLLYYGQYETDKDIIEQIAKILPEREITITIALGTWCSDTKEQLPVFQRIIDQLPTENISVEMIGVDRDKLAGELDIFSLQIEFVPTFIFYEKGEERGRIVEIPSQTMEKDILNILTK